MLLSFSQETYNEMWVLICVMEICLSEIKLVMLSKHKWKLKLLLIKFVFIFHVIWLDWFNGARKQDFPSCSLEEELLYFSFLIKGQQWTCFNVDSNVKRHFLQMVNWFLSQFSSPFSVLIHFVGNVHTTNSFCVCFPMKS